MPAGSARRRGGVFTNTDEAPPQTDEESWADLCLVVPSRSIRPESPACPWRHAAARPPEGIPGRRSGHSGTAAASLVREFGVCPRTAPPPGNAVASGLHLGAAGDCSPGGGTASRRRRERRSTGQNDNRLAANATERQATARFWLSRPGRSVPTREAGTTPGRIARNIRQRSLASR